MSDPTFRLIVDEHLDLVLRELRTVPEVHRLILANLERLREWEPWAQGEQTEEGLRTYTRLALQEWIEGRQVPCLIRQDSRIVGGVTARIDDYTRNAEVGYWIDAEAGGQGLVTRATGALIEHLIGVQQVQRVEIHCGTGNGPSQRVAERLGFRHEGTLASAMPMNGTRMDVMVYGLALDRLEDQPDTDEPVIDLVEAMTTDSLRAAWTESLTGPQARPGGTTQARRGTE